MEILRLKQVEWQNCKYQKTYFSFTETKYVFNRSRRTRVITFWTAGFKLEKGRDSLARLRMNRYLLITTVGFKINDPDWIGEREKRHRRCSGQFPAVGELPRRRHHRRRPKHNSDHQTIKGEHREIEKLTANSPRAKIGPEDDRKMAASSRWWLWRRWCLRW
jgi:hypothetical protein